MERGQLHTAIIDKLGVLCIEPALAQSLIVEERTGIWGRERNLYGVRIDLGGKSDRLLDRLPGFAGQAEDERPVHGDPEIATILAEPPRDVDQHSLLDVVQNLLIARLVTDQQ